MTPEDCRTEMESLDHELLRLLERRARLVARAKTMWEVNAAGESARAASSAAGTSHPAHQTEVGDLP